MLYRNANTVLTKISNVIGEKAKRLDEPAHSLNLHNTDTNQSIIVTEPDQKQTTSAKSLETYVPLKKAAVKTQFLRRSRRPSSVVALAPVAHQTPYSTNTVARHLPLQRRKSPDQAQSLFKGNRCLKSDRPMTAAAAVNSRKNELQLTKYIVSQSTGVIKM